MRWPSRALVFALGAAGLGGQVSWSRIAAAAVGGTLGSTALTLAAAMAGLAAGAFLAGRLLERRAPRGILLVVVASSAAALAAMPHLLLLLSALEGSLALRRVLAAALLALGHLPFGAVLPAAAAWRGVPAGRLAEGGGDLYAFGALGGVAGALLVGEVLAARLGLDAIGIILGAAALASGAVLRVPSSLPEASSCEGARPLPLLGPRAVGAIALGLGFLGLAVELLWIRVLGFHWQASTRTFGLVSAATIAGLAAGSMAASRWASRAGALPAALWTAALALVAAAALCDRAAVATSAGARVTAALLLAGLPAASFGAAFVLLLGSAGGKTGRTLGVVLGLNNLGSAAGPLVLWMAAPGVPWPAFALALAGVGYALLASAAGGRKIWAPLAAAAGLGVLGAAVVPKAPSPAVYLPGEQAEAADFEAIVLASLRPGFASTIAVTRQTDTGVETLWLDRTIQGDTSLLGRRIQERQGRLPCELLGRPARRSLLIGLGTGVTAAAAAESGAGSLDIAELSAGVLEAARTVLSEANGRLAERPNVRLHAGDGRTMLADASEPYDLVVVDIIFPSVPGAGNLFGREFYALARRRLAPEGLFLQWLPCFQLSPEDLSASAAAFLESFPDGSAWIGFLGPRRLILGLAGGRVRAPVPPRTLVHFALGPSELAELARGAAPLRDADPRLEYRSPPRADDSYGERNLERVIRLLRAAALPEAWEGPGSPWKEARQGWILLAEGAAAELRAEAAPPGSGRRSEELDRERSLYRQALQASPLLGDAEFLLGERAFEDRLQAAGRAMARGDGAGAMAALREAAADPLRGEGCLQLAGELMRQGRFEAALAEIDSAIAKHPRSADAYLKRAMLAYNLRDLAGARKAFERACHLRPDRPALYRKFAQLLEAGPSPGGR